MATRDDQDKTEGNGGPSTSGDKPDPPTLPPFSNDGPQPSTIHGVPSDKLLGGDGGLDDLFDVPKLGDASKSGPKPKAAGAPPPLPPLTNRKGPKPPTTGPLPIIPPVGANDSQAAKPKAAASKAPKPKPAPQPNVAGGSDGVPSKVVDSKPAAAPAGSPSMPAASSLIEKIRAAKRKAEADESSSAPPDDKPAPAQEPSDAKPESPAQELAAVERNDEPKRDATPAEPGDEPPEAAADTSSAMASAPATSSTLRGPPIPAAPPEPSDAALEDEQTIALSRQATRIGNPVPPPPSTPSAMAPPPPSTSADAAEQPRIGVPYEPPAVIIKDEQADEAEAREDGEAEADDSAESRGLPRPGRLPAPARRPPADPLVAARLAHAAPEQPTSIPVGAPQPVAQQDTASLIDGLADELVAKAERDKATTVAAKIPPKPTPAVSFDRRKVALYFLAGAAVLSLIVTLVQPREDASGEEDGQALVPDPAGDEPKPEPEQLAQAEPPQPEPQPPIPTEVAAETGGETDTGGETEAGDETETGGETEAEAEAEPAPKPESQRKRKRDPKPAAEPKPKPKPAPKPTPGGPGDTRSDAELYTAAKAAYNSGRASEAYKLAYASWRKRSKSKTAELMTLAACKMKDKGKANSSLKKVSLLRRNAVKKDCQAMGMSL